MSRVKLLSKREIDVAKARDRQREIAEGTKLAQRVDGLRELAADEEKSLNDFRIKTLTAINEETTPLMMSGLRYVPYRRIWTKRMRLLPKKRLN